MGGDEMIWMNQPCLWFETIVQKCYLHGSIWYLLDSVPPENLDPVNFLEISHRCKTLTTKWMRGWNAFDPKLPRGISSIKSDAKEWRHDRRSLGQIERDRDFGSMSKLPKRPELVSWDQKLWKNFLVGRKTVNDDLWWCWQGEFWSCWSFLLSLGMLFNCSTMVFGGVCRSNLGLAAVWCLYVKK